MATEQHITHVLAAAITAGRIAESDIVDRMARVLGKRWRWLRPLARRIEQEFAGRTRPRQRVLQQFIESDSGFRRASEKHSLVVANELACQPQMCPAGGRETTWKLPPITTLDQLADWFELPFDELKWLADRRGQESTTSPKYRRYRYRVLSKGLRRFRLIETPIYRLKRLQRQLLARILNHIEPHDASHGFRQGRSIHTFAANHIGCEVVLKMDLQDCFATIGFGRVSHLFRRVGYPERVADLLAAIATNSVPSEVWDSACVTHRFAPVEPMPPRYARPHLPQGSPTSPAIANSCLFKLDLRLAGLARAAGATYSRYADDLAFSGDAEFARCVERFRHQVAAIIGEEGFRVNHRKTRIMRASTRQRIAGVVVNQHRNIARDEYDQLKAILHNCRKHGFDSQNRNGHSDYHAHLAGRVAFVEAVNPLRGQRLREMLQQIEL